MQNVIVISPEGMFTSNPMSLEDGINLLITGIMQMAKNCTDAIEDETEREKSEREVFDHLNAGFGLALEHHYPKFTLHPEMTDAVIDEVIAAQDKKIINMAKHRGKKNK